MRESNEYMARTIKIGNIGEAFIRRILEWKGWNILKYTSNNSDWDCKAELNGESKTFEGKTQPDFADYGGFSVEVANRWAGNYLSKTPNFHLDGIPCVKTGLAVTKADYQVFTDGKRIAFFVTTEVLKKWFDDVISRNPHKIRWGGYRNRALQAQITISEILEISEFYVSNFAKKGKKSKSELAIQKALSYIEYNNKNK